MKKPPSAGMNPWLLTGIFMVSILLLGNLPIKADELVHTFKNPSFSGIGASAHY